MDRSLDDLIKENPKKFNLNRKRNLKYDGSCFGFFPVLVDSETNKTNTAIFNFAVLNVLSLCI